MVEMTSIANENLAYLNLFSASMWSFCTLGGMLAYFSASLLCFFSSLRPHMTTTANVAMPTKDQNNLETGLGFIFVRLGGSHG